jgi:hypothetical protein
MSQIAGQKVVFSSPDHDTGKVEPRVGILLYIGNETQIISHQEASQHEDGYPRYHHKVVGKDMIVFIVLHQPSGSIYKIYDERNIKIFTEKQKHEARKSGV